MKESFVHGFLISYDLEYFTLIDKGAKFSQIGTPLKWNGIGGRVNAIEFESPTNAMVREFQEETGHLIKAARWYCFMVKEFKDSKIYNFAAFGSLDELRKIHGHKGPEGVVELHSYIDVLFDMPAYCYDIPYLIQMVFRENRFGFFTKLDPEGVNSSARLPKSLVV